MAVLAARRRSLVPHAPVLWGPASEADLVHSAFLEHTLAAGGGVGVRTDDGVLVAFRGQDRWEVDDAWVPDGRWGTTGRELWGAFAAHAAGGDVRFVCPTPEVERTAFAEELGLVLECSWWHMHIGVQHASRGEPSRPAASPGQVRPSVAGAAAVLLEAPPTYAPGGRVSPRGSGE